MLQNILLNGKKVDQLLTGGKDTKVPKYTLRDIKTNETWDVTCSWNELQTILDEMPDVVKELSTPAFCGNTMSNLRRAGSGWQDVLNGIKKNSGAGNKIKT